MVNKTTVLAGRFGRQTVIKRRDMYIIAAYGPCCRFTSGPVLSLIVKNQAFPRAQSARGEGDGIYTIEPKEEARCLERGMLACTGGVRVV